MAAHAMLLACVLVYAPLAVGLVGRPGSPPRFFWQVLYARWPMRVTGNSRAETGVSCELPSQLRCWCCARGGSACGMGSDSDTRRESTMNQETTDLYSAFSCMLGNKV